MKRFLGFIAVSLLVTIAISYLLGLEQGIKRGNLVLDATEQQIMELAYADESFTRELALVLISWPNPVAEGAFGKPSIRQARYQFNYTHSDGDKFTDEIFFADNFTWFDDTHIKIQTYWKQTTTPRFNNTRLNPQESWVLYQEWKVLPIKPMDGIWYREPLSENGTATVYVPTFGVSIRDDMSNTYLAGDTSGLWFVRENKEEVN